MENRTETSFLNTEGEGIEWKYFFGGTVGNISTRWYKGTFQGREIEKCVTSSSNTLSTKKPKIELYEKGGTKKLKL